jgi:hypothetical protein
MRSTDMLPHGSDARRSLASRGLKSMGFVG